MKKITALLLMLAIALSLCSCGGGNSQDKFDIAQTRDIVLGDEVDSVVFTTPSGEKYTFDNNSDFYEIFNNISSEFENGMKCSYVAETKVADQSKSYINMNSYHTDDADFYESRVKKDGDDEFAIIDEYTSNKLSEESGRYEMTSFGRYIYKEEKAFGGYDGGTSYASDEYPLIPAAGTDLGEMHARGGYLRSLINSTELFGQYEAFENDGKTYDFEEFVTREFKLYENYIVLKQTSPFLSTYGSMGQDSYLVYMQFKNTDCSVTQEAYYNVETGKLELVKIYGDTMWHTAAYYGRKAEIDVQMYVYDLDEAECKERIDDLIDYVKSNIE